MKKMVSVLLALLAVVGAAHAENAAWLTYWDAEDAVSEAWAHAGGLDAIIVFEVFYDEVGEWVIPEETVMLLDTMRGCGAPVYLSVVNDVQKNDRSVAQKSRDFLAECLREEASREAQVERITALAEAYDIDGIEIDYENFKGDVDLWDQYVLFIARLYEELSETGRGMRVVMECQAPQYATFPEGPVYSCMCYNLYGYHSGPGPKANRDFLEQVGQRWQDMPGDVHMAFATGGFLWRDGKVVKALREQDANALLVNAGVQAERDEASMQLTAEIPGDEGGTLWYSDGETLRFWRETLAAMGYRSFDLFRLAGNESASLDLFLNGE